MSWWTDVEVYPLTRSREETIFMTLQLSESGADRGKKEEGWAQLLKPALCQTLIIYLQILVSMWCGFDLDTSILSIFKIII